MVMRTLISAAVLVAALPSAALVATPASAEVPTCRGQEATHVGTPGEDLTTTTGPDVVVTNGAEAVKTLSGDDVVCVTGDWVARVTPGRGDDLVDALAFDGGTTSIYLGTRDGHGSTGDDTVIGGDQLDSVIVLGGAADDHKFLSLGPGQDFLNVLASYPGAVTAELGPGRDEYWNERPRAGVSVDGGRGGRDGFVTECDGCQSIAVALQTGTVEVNGAPAGHVEHVEAVYVTNFDRDHSVRTATLIGTQGDEYLQAKACHGIVRGLGGADTLRAGAATRDDCDNNQGEIYGGAGDDVLWGRIGDDILRGGPGTDLANGRDGTDLCRAEERRQCEL
jgi:hypothetical protein